MRSINTLGLGMLVGFVALAVMVSIITYRWQGDTFSAEAPKVASTAAAPVSQVAMGKTIFETKCTTCHSVGGGKKIGPDLKGVANRRSQDWLVKFITAPDKVINSGDPTATQLVKDYGMPMPNLGVSENDAKAVLEYITSQ